MGFILGGEDSGLGVLKKGGLGTMSSLAATMLEEMHPKLEQNSP